MDANEATCNHIGARPNKQTRTNPARISIEKQGTKTAEAASKRESWYVLPRTTIPRAQKLTGSRKNGQAAAGRGWLTFEAAPASAAPATSGIGRRSAVWVFGFG
jgi:hypothetical protein